MPHYKDTENKLHWLDSAEYEHLLPAGCVPITDEEADALRPKPAELTYAQKRAAEYPLISDQLDYIYHHGVDAWKQDVVAPVKAKYPKV
jgi:hypothetical protein